MTTSIYNQKGWIDRFINIKANDAFEVQRISKILVAIPQDVKTVLDVGTGAGAIFRKLKDRKGLDCFGIDISFELVNRLNDNIVVADASNIPFKDAEFDMVLAGDFIEHIEEGHFAKSVSEMIRVSKKYILINSPYKDVVNWPVSLCGKCGMEFNIYGHVRTVNIALIKKIFPKKEFDFIRVEVFGRKRDMRPSNLVYIARRWGKVYSREGVVCPHCLNKIVHEPIRNLFERFLGRLVLLIFYLTDNFIPSAFKSGSEILILLKKAHRAER